MKEGQEGIITFGDKSTAKVRLVKNEVTSIINNYWLEYVEGETNKQLVHPDYGKKDIILSEILLPEFLFNKVVKLI